jgi:ribosomal RNA-processing protein 9
VVEETQLVFRGGGSSSKKSSKQSAPVLEGSMDRVAMIDEELFITGGDNGSLSLWSINKKKPIFTLPVAHGREPAPTDDERFEGANPEPGVIARDQPRWITALRTVPYSDVVLSGSWDGWIRAWKVSADKKKLEEVGAIASHGKDGQELIRGIINDIALYERGERAKDGLSIVVAVGKEHRLGRWKREKGKNGLIVLEVARKEILTNGIANGVHGEDEDDE